MFERHASITLLVETRRPMKFLTRTNPLSGSVVTDGRDPSGWLFSKSDDRVQGVLND